MIKEIISFLFPYQPKHERRGGAVKDSTPLYPSGKIINVGFSNYFLIAEENKAIPRIFDSNGHKLIIEDLEELAKGANEKSWYRRDVSLEKKCVAFFEEVGADIYHVRANVCFGAKDDVIRIYKYHEEHGTLGWIKLDEDGEVKSFKAFDGSLEYTLKSTLSQEQLNASILTYFEDDKRISKYIQKFAAELMANTEKLVFNFLEASGSNKEKFEAEFSDKASMKALRNAIKTTCNAKKVLGGKNGQFSVVAK